MSHRSLPSVLSLVGLLACDASPDVCDFPCRSADIIQIAAADGAVDAGDYTLTVEGAGAESTCSFTVREDGFVRSVEGDASCTWSVVGYTDTASSAPAQGIELLRLDELAGDLPDTLTVEIVESELGLVADVTVSIERAEQEACNGVCTSADGSAEADL